MQQGIINEENILAEIVVETPLQSLQTSDHVRSKTSHGLVRLAASTGRFPTVKLTQVQKNPPSRPEWRTLRQRAKNSTNTEVTA